MNILISGIYCSFPMVFYFKNLVLQFFSNIGLAQSFKTGKVAAVKVLNIPKFEESGRAFGRQKYSGFISKMSGARTCSLVLRAGGSDCCV